MSDVWVVRGRFGRSQFYHSDRDCRHIADLPVRDPKEHELEDMQLCRTCSDETVGSGAGEGHIESLRDAADTEGSV